MDLYDNPENVHQDRATELLSEARELDSIDKLIKERDMLCYSMMGVVATWFRYGRLDDLPNKNRVAELLVKYDDITDKLDEWMGIKNNG